MNKQVPAHQKSNKPRLTPVENPPSLKTKLAYWLTKKQLGKVITPLKVIYARFPESLSLGKALVDMEDKFTIDRELQLLIQTYTATLNGCTFCVDIAKANLQQQDKEISLEKLNELMKFEDSDRFSEAEKTAIAYADEATRNKQVRDETFEHLQYHYNEREIVEITMVNAIENFYNTMNAPMNIGSDELCELWSKEQ